MSGSPRPTGFSPPPPELVERFEWLAARLGGVERRRMFGYPALFVGGNLVAGLYDASWMVRLGDDDRAVLLALPGAAPFEPMPGRTMTGYATLPAAVIADDAQLEAWVGRAVAFGRTLPPKGRASRRSS